jgi:hypothetical protein
MSIKDGGPAFPCEQGHGPDGTWNQTFDSGMTLRDYFAGKAMQATINECSRRSDYAAFARQAYEVADAMIAARENTYGQ